MELVGRQGKTSLAYSKHAHHQANRLWEDHVQRIPTDQVLLALARCLELIFLWKMGESDNIDMFYLLNRKNAQLRDVKLV